MRHTTRHLIPKWLLLIAVVLVIAVAVRGLVAIEKPAEIINILGTAFVAAALFFALLAAGVTYYEYHGFGSQEGVVRRGPHSPYVSLTFDDGPNPTFTPQILDILKEKETKATFFVVGKHVEKYPEIAKRIVEEGHELGNHTYSHRDLVPSTRELVLKEVGRADEVIKKVTGAESKLFRPPRGIFSQAVRKLLCEEGWRIILWTVSTTDWRGINAKAILRRIKLYARNGAIILFHDSGSLVSSEGASRSQTVASLPLAIDYLREKKGLQIVSLSRMLAELDEKEQEEESDQALEKV